MQDTKLPSFAETNPKTYTRYLISYVHVKGAFLEGGACCSPVTNFFLSNFRFGAPPGYRDIKSYTIHYILGYYVDPIPKENLVAYFGII